MATGDGINVIGTFATVQASSSTADTVMSAGANTTITTALGATESKYFLLDFKVLVTVGTPIADGYIAIYKKQSDQPDPTTSYLHTFVGNAMLDTSTGNYYLRGVPNDDPADEYFALNGGGATLTFSVQARGRTYGSEA